MKKVHFNFVVSEDDADTIFSCIQNSVLNAKERSCGLHSLSFPWSKQEKLWFKKHAKYLEKLMSKMKNKSIK